VSKLWTGLGPNVARNAIINAAELASYDQIKQSLMATGMFKDNIVTHLAAGAAHLDHPSSALIPLQVSAPVSSLFVLDRLSTLSNRESWVPKILLDKNYVCAGDTKGLYAGVLDCFVKTFRNDGITAFYKGFIPNFGRLGSWNVAMFLVLEQAKAFVSKRLNPTSDH